MKIVHSWLRELVDVPDDPETVAREIALRGFEVAEIECSVETTIDFEITANRPDCLSHVGIAREASVIWGQPVRLPDLTVRAGAGGSGPSVDVQLEDPELCPRYCAQVFEVRVAPSPAWLAQRLQAAGVRPINNVVDVTNYVLLEIGQPMHAFDVARLGGQSLVIRRPRTGERMQTLDGVERALESDMLVIADAERATAIGGVMGGLESEIGADTRHIALESAYFHPPSIRRTSKRLGLKTEASIRFERGGDINAPPAGIARAAALLARIDAGQPVGPLIDRYPAPRQPVSLGLRSTRVARLLGQEVPREDVPRILQPLGFHVESQPGNDVDWSIEVPTFRIDVSREADLIEEIGRHYGFDRLPVTFPALTSPQAPPDPRIARERRVRELFRAAGFSEAVTFAFIERQAALPFCAAGTEPASIANPLSEKFAVLRPSLLPGLLDACVHNWRRERKDVKLFETGSRFAPQGEGRAAAFVWCGTAERPHWSVATRTVDFFDVKGVAELVASACGVSVDPVAIASPVLVRGRAAEIRVQNGSGQPLAIVGQIAPAIAEARGFPATEEIFAGEFDLDVLAAESAPDDLQAQPLPRFPSIVRDVSILVDEALPAASVRGTIRSAAPSTLVSIVEFDRYQGPGIPEGRVSLSLRLTFRALDRTLTDDDAQEATARIVDALRSAHAAERR